MDSEIQQFQCKQCDKLFERTVFKVLGRDFSPRFCKECTEVLGDRLYTEEDEDKRKRLEARWEEVCPPIYRDTKADDPRLDKSAVRVATGWNMRKGLGLIGATGRGKTRCLFLALRKALEIGLSVQYVTHNKFSRAAMDAYSGGEEEKSTARRLMRNLKTTRVLFLDDLGKPPSTERADAELEELIEERTNHNLLILWTANSSGDWLIKRLGPDRGEPIVRRLAEFCEVHTLR